MKIAMLLLLISLVVVTYGKNCPCDDIRYKSLQTKIETEMSMDDKLYVKEYFKKCEDYKENKKFHLGRFLIWTGAIVATLVVINAASESSK